MTEHLLHMQGYQNERVILHDGLKGRILLILPHDPPNLNKKVGHCEGAARHAELNASRLKLIRRKVKAAELTTPAWVMMRSGSRNLYSFRETTWTGSRLDAALFLQGAKPFASWSQWPLFFVGRPSIVLRCCKANPFWLTVASCLEQVFLYVACTKQVIGCLVAEPISTANPVATCSQEEVRLQKMPMRTEGVELLKMVISDKVRCFQEEVESSFKPTRERGTHASPGLAGRMEGVCTAPGDEATAPTTMKQGRLRQDVPSSAVLSELSPSTRCLALPDDEAQGSLDGSRRILRCHRVLQTGDSQLVECSTATPNLRSCPAPNPRPSGSDNSAARLGMGRISTATPSLQRWLEGSHDQRGPPPLKDTPLTRWLQKVKPDRGGGVVSGKHAAAVSVGETSASSLPSNDCMSFGRVLDRSSQGRATCSDRKISFMAPSPMANFRQHDVAPVDALSEGAAQQSCHETEAEAGRPFDASLLRGGTVGAKLPHVEEGLRSCDSGVADPQPTGSAGPFCQPEENASAVRVGADANCARLAAPHPTKKQGEATFVGSRRPDAQVQEGVCIKQLQKCALKRPIGPNKLYGGQRQGFGALYTTDDTREAHLGVRVIWVARDSQRQGVARKLLDTAR